MAAERVVTVCVKGFPGVDRALINLSQTTGLSRHVTLVSATPNSSEVAFFVEHLRRRRPALVIFGAWSPIYGALLEGLAGEPIAFAAYWHSSPGQTDMSREVGILAPILADRRLDYVLFTSRSFVEALTIAGRGDVYHLPQTLEVPPQATDRARDAAPGGPPTITFFCYPAEYHRKNGTNCLLALAGVRAPYRLLLNGLSQHPHYRALLDSLPVRYEERGWMDRAQYEAAVANAALGLQVSFSESYCYVAAEHLIRGVPVIGSPMVPVLDRLSLALRARLVVSSAESVPEIRDKVQYFLDRSEARAEIGWRARAELATASERDVKTARGVLAALLEDQAERRGTTR